MTRLVYLYKWNPGTQELVSVFYPREYALKVS